MALLARIDSPRDLKVLSLEELKALAQQIRESMVDTVSQTGGHLASSLGAVELAIALHYVFDTPHDRLIWDVGHQAYAHKLLTGRRDQFTTLRQQEGMSGFLKRSESIYDTFGAGHAGTSLSAALGMVEALNLKGEKARVIAVIGDGAMTAGMAFEALNNAGHRGLDLTVVLNDNEMSISPNVGALASFLSRKLTGPFFTGLRKEIHAILKSIPGIGPDMARIARRAEEALKGFLTPGMLFESLGFQYVGPLDGHRLEDLIRTLENSKAMQGPVLVHITTTKGKGYGPAERNPVRFHSAAPFDIRTGKEKIAGPGPLSSYTEVFSDTLIRLAEQDPRVVAITAAMPSGTGLDRFAQRFPDRSFDVGIAEQHAITFSAGLACEGLRPVVAIYSTFLQRGYDQVIHDVCLQNLPVLFALDRSGIVGQDGPTHQGLFDFSFLRSIPNMTVMAPRDENELAHMLKTGLELEGPASIRFPRGRAVGVPRDENLRTLPVGKAELLLEGEDLLILAIGSPVHAAWGAALNLKGKGIKATVINCRFVKPLDEELIASLASQIGTVITVEENALAGGFGSAVLELLETRCMSQVWLKRLGIPDQFVEQGPSDLWRKKFQLDQQGIEETALSLLHNEPGYKKGEAG